MDNDGSVYWNPVVAVCGCPSVVDTETEDVVFYVPTPSEAEALVSDFVEATRQLSGARL